MKKELNTAIAGWAKVNEIGLFREMANQFNNNVIAKCTYVKEVHKMMVDFPSDFAGGNMQKELGDLLLLTFDKAKRELRLCVLQAKYKKGMYRYFLNCHADLYQWELLYYKPNVMNSSSLNFPNNILNFRHDYKSITAYGIFYHDYMSHDIDFLYTLPEFFTPQNLLYPYPKKKMSKRSFIYTCPKIGTYHFECYGCTKNKCGMIPKETLYTCSMDIFEQEVLFCRIGAPIDDDPGIKKYILSLLSCMKKSANSPQVIDEILDNYDFDYRNNGESDIVNDQRYPAAIIVVTDSKMYKEMQISMKTRLDFEE